MDQSARLGIIGVAGIVFRIKIRNRSRTYSVHAGRQSYGPVVIRAWKKSLAALVHAET